MLDRSSLDRALDELIVNQRWADLQRIALALARQLCPALIANELSADGGEDGFIADGALNDERTLAVACSLTATWPKIAHDLERIKSRKPEVNTLWFYTPREVRAVTSDPWRDKAKEEFGVTLTVMPREEIAQRLLDPHNHYLIERHLTTGLAPPGHWATSLGTRSSIRAFFEEYLISEVGPIPFGGRDVELQKLDAWFADVERPSRFLLTGPAGRGKSALLVRWFVHLQNTHVLSDERCGWRGVFVPISMRFGTNEPRAFYRILAEGLARILSHSLPQPSEDPASYYANQARELLNAIAKSKHRVLLIIDGLDEALRADFDPTILPRVLPDTLRVIVAARLLSGDTDSNGWIRRLNWMSHVRYESLELSRLDAMAVRDVLLRMGAPLTTLAEDSRLIRQLTRLSRGEPLILSFYASDLWGRAAQMAHITESDLENLKPGFGAYFDRWLELQKKEWRASGEAVNLDEVDFVLMVFAYACGPLQARDVVTLVSLVRNAAHVLVVQRLLEPLRRFVIGDGSAERGYVLSHPMIGEHLRAERYHHLHDHVEGAFLSWGRNVLQDLQRGQRDPSEVPRYLLQFFRTHLSSARASFTDYLALTSDGWRRAWESFEGGYRGFASDVRTVMTVLKEQRPPASRALQVRCSLILSSIQSLGRNVPRQLIVAAVRARVLTPRHALQLATLMHSHSELVMTVADLVPDLQQDFEIFQEALDEALLASSWIDRGATCVRALAALAPYYRADQVLEALRIAERIEHETHRVVALISLSPFVDKRALRRILQTAYKLHDEWNVAHLLSGLGPSLTDALVREALDIALDLDHSPPRIQALTGLLPSLSEGQRARAIEHIVEALELIDNEYLRTDAISALLPRLGSMETRRFRASLKMGEASVKDRLTALRNALTALLPDLHVDNLLQEPALDEQKLSHPNCVGRLLAALIPGFAHSSLGEQLTFVQVPSSVSPKEEVKVFEDAAFMAALNSLVRSMGQEEMRLWVSQPATVWSCLKKIGPRPSIPYLRKVLRLSSDDATMDQRLAIVSHALDALYPPPSMGQLSRALFPKIQERSTCEPTSTLAAPVQPESIATGVQRSGTHFDPESFVAAFLISDSTCRGYVLQTLFAGQQEALFEHWAPQLEEAEWRIVLQQISDGLSHADCLRIILAVCPALKHDVLEPFTERALSLISEISGIERDTAIRKLTPYVTEEQLARLLAEAQSARDEATQVMLLGRLAPFLAGNLLEAAFRFALGVTSGPLRSEALASLAMRLRPEQIQHALAATKIIADAVIRRKAHLSLEAHQPGPGGKAGLSNGWSQLRTISSEAVRVDMLAMVAGHLDPPKLRDALAIVAGIRDEKTRLRGLATLTPYLSPSQLIEAKVIAMTLPDVPTQVEGLCAILRCSSGSVHRTTCRAACRVAKGIEDSIHRARSWANIAASTKGQARAAAVKQSLMADACARGITSNEMYEHWGASLELGTAIDHMLKHPRAHRGKAVHTVLIGALKRATNEEVGLALPSVLTAPPDEKTAWALRAFVPYLNQDQRRKVLGVATKFDSAHLFACATSNMAGLLTRADLARAVGGCSAIGGPETAEVLADLAAHLSDEDVAGTFDDALQSAARHRAYLIAGLATRLNIAQVDKALPNVLPLGVPEGRDQVLIALAPRMTRHQLLATLNDLLEGEAAWVHQETFETFVRALPVDLLDVALNRLVDVGATLPRSEFVTVLSKLVPAFLEVTDIETMGAMSDAIDEVASWYP